MKIHYISMLAAVGLFAAQDPVADIRMGVRGAPVTIEGNLIDLDCYMEHGGFGPEHEDCSRFCNRKGLPAALLDGAGDIYLIHGRAHQPLPAVNEPLLPYMESTVVLHGELLKRGDLRVVVVDKVARARNQRSWDEIRELYRRSASVRP